MADNDMKKHFSIVASYNYAQPEKAAWLLPYHEAVAALGAGGENFFLTTIAEGMEITTRKGSLEVLKGEHPAGFQITVVKAAHEGNGVFMPVIGDAVAGKVLVLGPGAAPEGLEEHIVYVDNRQPGVADKVNDFLVNGARLRGEKGLLNPEQVRTCVEDLLGAVEVLGTTTQAPGVDTGATVGAAFAEVAGGKAGMSAYILALDHTREAEAGLSNPVTVKSPLKFKPRS